MIEIRFDKTKDEVALLIWFLVDHSVLFCLMLLLNIYKVSSQNYQHINLLRPCHGFYMKSTAQKDKDSLIFLLSI
jgi:hypothetical protein